jgi:branched-subunit amino acid ABC-type transport system permease component
MHQFFQSIGFGLVTGSVIALAAVGVTIQAGITNFLNFAAGDFMTLGAYFGYLMVVTFHVGLVLGFISAAVVTALLAVLMNRFVFKWFVTRKARVVTMTILTLGISLLMSGALEIGFGAVDRPYGLNPGRTLSVGPFSWTSQQLVIILVAVAILVSLEAGLRWTKAGKALRAMSDNRDLAAASGINTRRLTNLTWMLSGAMLGVAGVVLVMQIGTVSPTTGEAYLFLLMAPVVMGGFGKPIGTMVGSYVMGLVLELSSSYINAAYADAFAFGVLIIVLLIRPNGIFSAQGLHT